MITVQWAVLVMCADSAGYVVPRNWQICKEGGGLSKEPVAALARLSQLQVYLPEDPD